MHNTIGYKNLSIYILQQATVRRLHDFLHSSWVFHKRGRSRLHKTQSHGYWKTMVTKTEVGKWYGGLGGRYKRENVVTIAYSLQAKRSKSLGLFSVGSKLVT